MKINSPSNRNAVKILPNEKVLDVGGGNQPYRRANVVVDKYDDDNTHRGGDLKVFKRQEFIKADGTSLPFKDKEFDYVNCCHVAEHVDDPDKFFTEIARVGKRGYIEVPSLIGEFLAPKKSHIWVSLDVDDKIVMMRKSDLGIQNAQLDFGKLFLAHMSDNFVAYKILIRQYPDLFTVRQLWQDKIEYLINPKDPEIVSLFQNPWPEKVIRERFQPRGKVNDILEVCKIFGQLITHKVWQNIKAR